MKYALKLLGFSALFFTSFYPVNAQGGPPSGSWDGWNHLEPQVEVRLKVPAHLFGQFRQMHQNLFKTPNHNWQSDPRGGFYYRYSQNRPAGSMPYYISDSYYNQFSQFQQVSPPPKAPLASKKYKTALPPQENDKYIKENGELHFEKIGEVYFPSGSSKVTNHIKKKLAKISKAISPHKYRYINIKGFTDLRGKKEVNHKLGLKRAKNVANYLENLGIDMSKAYIGSGGETRDKKKLKLNRRVEVIGFFSPLPLNTKLSFNGEKLAVDNGPSFFIIMLVVLLFMGIMGSAIFVITTKG